MPPSVAGGTGRRTAETQTKQTELSKERRRQAPPASAPCRRLDGLESWRRGPFARRTYTCVRSTGRQAGRKRLGAATSINRVYRPRPAPGPCKLDLRVHYSTKFQEYVGLCCVTYCLQEVPTASAFQRGHFMSRLLSFVFEIVTDGNARDERPRDWKCRQPHFFRPSNLIFNGALRERATLERPPDGSTRVGSERRSSDSALNSVWHPLLLETPTRCSRQQRRGNLHDLSFAHRETSGPGEKHSGRDGHGLSTLP